MRKKKLDIIGWREWVGLPEIGVSQIKAKVDTGARTSALHAIHIREFEKDGEEWLRFKVHPLQDDNKFTIESEVRLYGRRRVKSSNGKSELRPVIKTELEFLGRRWPIELTLTRRDSMRFRMLLGRQAIRGKAVVDVGHSFITHHKEDQK